MSSVSISIAEGVRTVNPGDLVKNVKTKSVGLVVAVVQDHNMYGEKFMVVSCTEPLQWTTRFYWMTFREYVDVVTMAKNFNFEANASKKRK